MTAHGPAAFRQPDVAGSHGVAPGGDIPAFVDRYRPVALLGRGSYAEVFRAVDQATGQEVALKILNDRVSDTAVWPAQELFDREVATVRTLQHPGVVPILDAGYLRDPILPDVQRPAIVMPVVEGETLAQVIARGTPWSAPEVVRFLMEACAILEHLQAHDIVHRDLGPQNIYRTTDGRYLISDFGLARPLDSAVVTRLTGTLTGALAARLLYLDYANQSGVVTGASDLVSLARIGLALLRGAHYTGPVRTPPAGAEALVVLLNRQAADGADGEPARFRQQLRALAMPASKGHLPAPRGVGWPVLDLGGRSTAVAAASANGRPWATSTPSALEEGDPLPGKTDRSLADLRRARQDQEALDASFHALDLDRMVTTPVPARRPRWTFFGCLPGDWLLVLAGGGGVWGGLAGLDIVSALEGGTALWPSPAPWLAITGFCCVVWGLGAVWRDGSTTLHDTTDTDTVDPEADHEAHRQMLRRMVASQRAVVAGRSHGTDASRSDGAGPPDAGSSF